MKKILTISSAVVVISFAYYTGRRIEHLAARVASLEANANKTGVFPGELLQRSDPRMDRVEERVAAIERLLDEKIVRQKLDSNLKSIRDLPTGEARF
jgi:hypothetical protein